MTPETIAQYRKLPDSCGCKECGRLTECLDEIERLQARVVELEKFEEERRRLLLGDENDPSQY